MDRTNRVAQASDGLLEFSNQFHAGWVVVCLLVVIGFFVVGYRWYKQRQGRRRRFY
jgi:type II secretory pathway component PulF